MEAAKRLVAMITELRYTIATLAKDPILVDTGQYQPRYQPRTFADMENEISRDLAQHPNFQARVKLLAGEHTIQTKDLPRGLTGEQLAQRIAQIQSLTRRSYCKRRTEVETEIHQRQERLLYEHKLTRPTNSQPQRKGTIPPPPTHY
jgi:hypothetical protein